MAAPNREGGGGDSGDYQILNPISLDSASSESEYDYPATTLLIKPAEDSDGEQLLKIQEPAVYGNVPAPLQMEAKQVLLGAYNDGTLEPVNFESFSSSDGDSSDPSSVTVVKQVSGPKPRSAASGRGAMEDDKLFITGNLVNSSPSVFFKTSTGISSAGFTDEGIYQGLVMTDKQKKNIGILPESIYMTTNLLEKGALIESISLIDTTSAVAVEVPEVPLPPSSPPIFSRESAIAKDNTLPKSSPPKPPRRRSQNIGSAFSDQTPPRSIAPHYRDLILRPPPLPPLSSGANRAERRAFAVVENLLKSEAAYLTSLNIAIKVYMTSLLDQAEGPAPILSVDEIETIFGPITRIIEFQEIFYSAITSRTLDWTPLQKIGDVLSSLSTKDVVQNYSQYVNNFTVAMATLEKAINKKPKFVQFLKEKYANSRTSLSLQGLLLKPVQRFPQYIMFLQDLIKYTCSTHPDRVTLQMALARYEGIANFLNESKRQQEQNAVVLNLTNKISHLPFKLTDGKRWLCRQDIVTRLMVSNGKVVGKDRCLLLFNNMVLCAAMKRRKKKGHTSTKASKAEELESSTGSRDFQSINKFFYSCKWYCPLEKLELSTPDYLNDIWDHASDMPLEPEYVELKKKYKQLEQDSLKMGNIARIAATLQEEYKGLTCDELSNHVRIIQRKIAELKVELKMQQQGRLDITFPSREQDCKVYHTYAFQSEKCKLDWLNNFRYAKLKLKNPVNSSWVIAEDISQGDVFEVSYKLPLLVENYWLNMINNELLSVQCAAKVGLSYAWLASGDNRSAQVSIVECVTPSPLILECFKVDSKRIIDIIYVPPSSFFLGRNTDSAGSTFFSSTVRRNNRATLKALTHLPAYMATVWMGSQCGRVIIYNAESAGDGPKQCLATIKLTDAVTSIQYYKDQVFVSTAEGKIVIFKRTVNGLNLSNFSSVAVASDRNMAIRCTCIVGNKLWVGAGGSCFFFNMQTHKVEGNLEMSSREGVFVSKMVNQGEGVWVSYKGSSSLELFHTTSKSSLQNIDIKSTLTSIIKRHKLENRLPRPTHIHVTAIMAASGYLWIGTSVGAVMVYHIPHLESVPIVSGKPYLAMDGHVGAVRVFLTMETIETFESSRLGKFLADEQFRTIQEEIKAEESEQQNGLQNVTLPEEKSSLAEKRSASDPTLHISSQPQDTPSRAYVKHKRESIAEIHYEGTPTANAGGSFAETRREKASSSNRSSKAGSLTGSLAEENFERSVTPSLVDPMTIPLLEEEEEEDTVFEGNQKEGVEPLAGEESPPDEDDYDSDELEAKRKFGGGVRGTGKREGETDKLDLAPDKIDLAPDKMDLAPDKMDLAPDKMDLSMKDSGEYTIPYVDVQPSVLYGNVTANGEVLAEEDPYSNPSELDTVAFLKQARENDGHDGGYCVPHELDSAPNTEKEKDYDFPAELLQHHGAEVNPYEDPATLAKDPSSPLSQFSTKTTLYVPGRPVTREGATFVLTAGRGLVNLRPGKKAQTFNQANKDTEGCMIAYEIEM